MTNTATVSPLWKILTVLALLCCAGLAWFAHDQYDRQQKRWQHLHNVQQQQQQTLIDEQLHLRQRLASVQEKLHATQQEQENLRAIIAGGAERFADAQRMHAAEYFVLEAEKILMLAHDVPAVAKLLETADIELQGASSQTAQQLRAAIQRDRQQLQGLQHIDPLGIARQLSELQTRIDSLRSLSPVLKEKTHTSQYNAEQDTWWGQMKANIAHFSGDWFLVRDHAHAIEGPLTDLESRQIKQSITLSLANAQAAALRHEQGLYYNAITQAHDLIARHYGSDASAVTIAEQLQQLTQKLVSATATISLQSAQTIRAEKTPAENAL